MMINKRDGILQDLIEDGTSFHVWQAVWLSEQISRKNFPARKDYLLDQAGLNFRPYENYEYPPRDIRSINYENGEIKFILNFLGLYGINSPLPRCYHEQVSIQLRILGESNVPLQSFYDIFNNRFYWLYYQSWKKYRFYLFLNSKSENSITERLFSFIGRGSNSNNLPSIIPDYALLKFSGNLVQKSRNKTSLQILLSYLFPGFKMKIKEFVPHWVDISDLPELGRGNTVLGVNSFIGRKVIDYSSRICIEISEISFHEYIQFLPGTLNSKKLFELLNLYVNDGLEFDIRFTVNTEEISSVKLGDKSSKLDVSLWLGKPVEKKINIYQKHEQLASAA